MIKYQNNGYNSASALGQTPYNTVYEYKRIGPLVYNIEYIMDAKY